MSNPDYYQVPDLASILRTLSAYGPLQTPPPQTTQQQPLLNGVDYGIPYAPANPGLHALATEESFLTPQLENDPKVIVQESAKVTNQPPDSSQTIATVPKIDPTIITEWSAGLRFATKLFASNDQYGNRVRKMISGEQEHVKQWWAGREALVKKQESRVEGKRQLEEVLKSVGGQVSSTAVVNDDIAELKRYDMKVYKAQTEMVDAMSTDLAAMGVPFFGTKSHLIKDAKPKDSKIHIAVMEPISNDDSDGKRITKDELLGLQKRMLQFLEDMFKD